MSLIAKIFGDANSRFVKSCELLIREINALEEKFSKFSGEDLKNRTREFQERFKTPDGKFPENEKEILDEILPEAFAMVREAAKRTLGQRHFDVQLLGGIALHQGKIAEMKTGEGKTLVATLPVYLNALATNGKGGVHVITVNDYLSRRDAVWMGQIYNALGLSVGCLNHESSFLYDPAHVSHTKEQESQEDKTRDTLGSFKIVHEFLKPCTRREAYQADITYGTNNEFGFDYLRDNMAYRRPDISQSQHYFAVVDEIDSILIDEARTPLIISAPDTESEELYNTFSHIAPRLKKDRDYTVDEKMKAASITEEGIEAVEKMIGVKDIYTEKGIKYVRHLEQALRAEALFHKDKDYVVKDGEVIIVDEFTGRLMPGRRWSEGLHQAIEAKEKVTVQKESRTMASITFQNYFRMYKKLAGMTGTAVTSIEEFQKVYNLDVIVIPTNKPMIREDLSDLVFQTEEGKFKAIVSEIKKMYGTGQPVLVGTVSIERNEYLSALLKREGVPHRVLNAKHHEEEGEIIAQAGKKGVVTIATNMAGRGVDIVLGGNPPDIKESEEIKKSGGLFVLGSQRHEARRIDNQLRGRSGRQGDPGKTRFFVSLEDDLMRIFGSDRIKKMMGTFGIPEDQPIDNTLVSHAIESAQSKIEGLNFDARKHVLEYDDVMNKQRNDIYSRRRDILMSSNSIFKNIIKGLFEKAEQDFGLFEKKINEAGDENAFLNTQRIILLQVIDMLWVEHLETMEYMRSSVGLRAYGHRDPLVEYKNEGAKLYREMKTAIRMNYCRLALEANLFGLPASGEKDEGGVVMAAKPKEKNHGEEIGRNDPCWCGATHPDGRPIKYKHCHGK